MEHNSKQPDSHKTETFIQNPYNVYYNNYLNTNAATECTGLGYRMPLDQEEWNAYRNIFDFLPVPFQDSEDV